MSDKGNAQPFTDEERDGLQNWACVLQLGEGLPHAEIYADELIHYEATVCQVEAERDAWYECVELLLEAVGGLERLRDTIGWGHALGRDPERTNRVIRTLSMPKERLAEGGTCPICGAPLHDDMMLPPFSYVSEAGNDVRARCTQCSYWEEWIEVKGTLAGEEGGYLMSHHKDQHALDALQEQGHVPEEEER